MLDTPFFDLPDARGLDEEARGARRLGFTGKCAVHPKQIGPINDVFSPTAKDVAQAEAVLAENEKGIGVVDGQMIDEAIARRARRVLALARWVRMEDARLGEPAEARQG